MTRFVIRYGWEPQVKTRVRGVMGATGEKPCLPTSLNPYLLKPGHFRRNYLEDVPCRAILLDFDELFAQSSKTILFTYTTDTPMEGKRVRVMRYMYSVPSCAREMEIRFHFKTDKVLKGTTCTDEAELVEKVGWASVVDLAEHLTDFIEKGYKYLKELGFGLNAYFFMKDEGSFKGVSENKRKKAEQVFEPVLELIADYDRKITRLARKLEAEC